MDRLWTLLPQTALFHKFNRDELISALLCLEGVVRSFSRRQTIISHGESLQTIGLVLSGMVHIAREDESGAQVIHFGASEGDIFGETSLQYDTSSTSDSEQDDLGFTATAAVDSEVLFIRTEKITQIDDQGSLCALRSRMIENLLRLIVSNNRGLYHKLDLAAHRSLRSKIMHYLELQARRKHTCSITIPFSRSELADYLMVDRSALSRELTRMADDALISFSRNTFELHFTTPEHRTHTM